MAISDSNIAPDKGVFNPSGEFKRRERPDLGTVQEPARDIPVFATTDVLIVGGGPAGATAAIAAVVPAGPPPTMSTSVVAKPGIWRAGSWPVPRSGRPRRLNSPKGLKTGP